MAKEEEGGEDIEIEEKGEIYFFYRPKVEKEEAHSSDDVQQMYIVLRPTGDNNPTAAAGRNKKLFRNVFLNFNLIFVVFIIIFFVIFYVSKTSVT